MHASNFAILFLAASAASSAAAPDLATPVNPHSSVNWQFSFSRVLDLSNQQKPAETRKLGNLATYSMSDFPETYWLWSNLLVNSYTRNSRFQV
jgi:hypothetical protein